MVMRTTGHSNLLAPGLRKNFFLWLKDRPNMVDKLYNTDTSKRNHEDDYVMSGLGVMPSKAQGESVTYDDPVAGSTRRYTHTTYALGFRVSKEMIDDDLYGPARRMNEALAKSYRNRINVDTFATFNNGFSTVTTYDTLSLYNTAHTLLRGGTQANRPSTEADFSVTSLQSAIETFLQTVDEDNMYAVVAPKLVFGHVNNRSIFKEVLDSELKPYTNNNEINPLLDEGISWMDTPFITDTDAWYLHAGKGDHSLYWIWRTQVKYENSDDFDTGDAKFKAVCRYSVGATHYVGTYGTQGA